MERRDWQGLNCGVDGKPMGAPAYHPRALLGVWVHDRGALVAETGGSLPGPDPVLVAERVPAAGP